ncbi:MAG: hypothetical protein GX639_12645 [Fibrobacter sp.]|nr:hypothetical protein [Fibrobacter sp.]
MIVEADGYRFNFPDAILAFKFDDNNPQSLTFHGAPMKAVDIIVELPEAYLFVEIKEFDRPEEYDADFAENSKEYDNYKWLKRYLKYKFRDSYLYRHAENKTEKPIQYLCLLNFDDALNSKMKKGLKIDLPVGKASSRWIKPLAQSCQVLNLAAWNRNFPKWFAQKVATA